MEKRGKSPQEKPDHHARHTGKTIDKTQHIQKTIHSLERETFLCLEKGTARAMLLKGGTILPDEKAEKAPSL